MFSWKAVLHESPVDWLLEKENPSIQYITLRDVLGRKENDPELKAARQAIADSTIVKKILERQAPGGYWEAPGSPYLPKYTSSYWQIKI